jgi:hypothetical protein
MDARYLTERHMDNLDRLFRKYHARYGDDDALVKQLKLELDSCEEFSTAYRNRSNLNPQHINRGIS